VLASPLACDWRVLARDAYLQVPEVKIGLNLRWGALPRLITLVGPAPRQVHNYPVLPRQLVQGVSRGRIVDCAFILLLQRSGNSRSSFVGNVTPTNYPSS
jgi:hypothetical protein